MNNIGTFAAEMRTFTFFCIRCPAGTVTKVMKTPLALFLLGVSLVAPLRAQVPATIQYAPGALEQLVAPIALYPDPLIALILPASTASTDVVLAARYLEQSGDPAQIEAQPWDPSVQSLAHYPELISWMSSNLAWTQALGQAYAAQPTAVMQAVQTMRAKALAAGNLQTTPQQQVVQTANVIEIVPVEPSVIYVPYYDWNVVYEPVPVWSYPLVSFRLCYPIGPWLSFGCDWRDHRIVAGGWHRDWDDRRGWDRRPDFDRGNDRGDRRDWDRRRDGDRWIDHGDRGAAVAGHVARPPGAPRIDNPAHFDPRPGRASQAPAFTQNRPGRRAVDSPPRVGTTPPRMANAQPRIQNSPPRIANGRPRIANPGPRIANSPPRTPASRPNFPAWNAPQRGPNPNDVRAFPRAVGPNRAPAQSFAQSSPPRSFGGHNNGGRPAYQPSARPSAQSPAPRASSPSSDRGDSNRRQGRASR